MLRPRPAGRRGAGAQKKPSWSRAASLIMLWFQGGSKTTSTSAWPTPASLLELRSDVRGEDVAHAAAGGGERHLDLNVAAGRRRPGSASRQS